MDAVIAPSRLNPIAARPAPIAYICRHRQVHVLDVNGRVTQQTGGGDPQLMWGWWNDSKPSTAHAWPTWSPDGRSLACFSTSDAGESMVLVFDVDGVSSTAVGELEGRLPIYLFWSPRGDRLAILSQRVEPGQDRLELSLARPGVAGSESRLVDGTPLFFTWAGERIAAFVGDPDGHDARLVILPTSPRGATTLLPGRPGNFCAPVWLGDRLVYVLQQGSRASIVSSALDDAEPTELETLRGLIALVNSPDNRFVARAVAAGGDGTPYRDLAVIDIQSGQVVPIAADPCLAFFWLPDGSGLVTAQVDTERNLMTWRRVWLDGRSEHLIDMYPTRDFGFYLRFFEQYAQSHSVIDPTGTHLLLAGGVHGSGDPHRTTALWEVPLDGGAPTQIAEGVFGVYGPAPAT